MVKSILITGSTDGIGKLVAIRLAKEKHHVYIHGRNPEKLEATVSEIKAISHNEQVEGLLADFSDLEDVKNMATKLKQQGSKIDILINNAGIFKSSASTKTGIDIRLVVNYLAPYLLTNALLPLIEKSTAPRIINLSSAAQAPVSLNALKGNENLSTQLAYAQSKLAITMWSFDLAKKLKNTLVIAVNPGSLLNTKMVQEAYGNHWSPANKGSDILYDLAISEEYKDSNGKYFDNDKGEFSTAHPDAYNREKLDQLHSTTDSILLD